MVGVRHAAERVSVIGRIDRESLGRRGGPRRCRAVSRSATMRHARDSSWKRATASENLGTAIAAMIPMIRITTTSSKNEKPGLRISKERTS